LGETIGQTLISKTAKSLIIQTLKWQVNYVTTLLKKVTLCGMYVTYILCYYNKHFQQSIGNTWNLYS